MKRLTPAETANSQDAPAAVNEVLNSPGTPLDAGTRAYMEPRFGHDFSQVRVHTDAKAAASARGINALAYTSGNNVVFNTGLYSPDTNEGKRLLGHELTHVVQQNGMSSGVVQRALIYQGRILDEGSCQHLACYSRWACEDNVNGVSCPVGSPNYDAIKKYRPLFTCDIKCENNRTCSDADNWMALPNNRFEMSKCGQDLTICANGRLTHGIVRDRSNVGAWEVGHGIQDALGLSSYASFRGSIYGEDTDAGIQTDPNCRQQTKK